VQALEVDDDGVCTCAGNRLSLPAASLLHHAS
jgi:hypothetical protein